MGDPHAGGVQRLAEKLSAGALPAVTWLDVRHRHVGDAGDSALAAALGRGALPRLKYLELSNTGIGDAGLVALAPALLALPALGRLDLNSNPLGDEGLAALLAPPPTAGRLTKLKQLGRSRTWTTDAGCAALAATHDSGALPALIYLDVEQILATDAVTAALEACLQVQPSPWDTLGTPGGHLG